LLLLSLSSSSFTVFLFSLSNTQYSILESGSDLILSTCHIKASWKVQLKWKWSYVSCINNYYYLAGCTVFPDLPEPIDNCTTTTITTTTNYYYYYYYYSV
jgi:hypothetical protein